MQHVAPGGARDARKIDAPMLFVVLIFDRGDRVVEHLGTLLVGHQDAALQSEAADQLPVVGVNFRNHRGPVRFQRANLRQVAGIHKEQPARRAQRNRAKQQKRQRHAVDQLPTAQPQCNRRQTQHENPILAQMNGLAGGTAFFKFPSPELTPQASFRVARAYPIQREDCLLISGNLEVCVIPLAGAGATQCAAALQHFALEIYALAAFSADYPGSFEAGQVFGLDFHLHPFFVE